MIKLKSILRENEQLNITIEDVESLIASKWTSQDVISLLRTIEEFYYSDNPKENGWAKDYLNLLNEVMTKVIKLTKNLNVPHINIKFIKNNLLKQQGEFKFKVEEFFPFPVYVSAKPNVDGYWAEIGILIDQNGKVLEIFEGNDEASVETIQLVNQLVNPAGKSVRIYGLHNTNLCHKIKEEGYLPPNLYVSPDKEHASRHWDNTDRSMFTGMVNINDLSQESEIDWKTIKKTKIDKFKWI